jgi:hypothetical protein
MTSADHAQPQDKMIPQDKMVLPDKMIPPDKKVLPDKMVPHDKMVPPDKGFSCGSHCDASSCNTTQILHVCPFVCSNSTSSAVQLCSVPASKVQGRWIRAVRISRGIGASDGLATWLKLEPQ